MTTGIALSINCGGSVGAALPAVGLTDIPATVATQLPTLHVQEQATSGSNSTSPVTANAWNTRVLNTVVKNTAGASLGSNQITLPAGTWQVRAWVPASTITGVNAVTIHRARVFNVTDSAALLLGSSGNSGSGSVAGQFGSSSEVMGSFTITATKVISLDQWITTGSNNAIGGTAAGSGDVEVYAEIELQKVA